MQNEVKINLIGTPQVTTSDLIYDLLREREDRKLLRISVNK